MTDYEELEKEIDPNGTIQTYLMIGLGILLVLDVVILIVESYKLFH